MIRQLAFRGSLNDSPQLAAHLEATGLGPDARLQKAQRFAEAVAALRALDGVKPTSPVHAFFVPGRIEVLGKHTDYAGGRSLVTATEQGFSLVVTPRPDRQVRLIEATRGQTVEFALAAGLSPGPGQWSNYPMTVVRRLMRNFPDLACGADIAFTSDLPQAAGMSSSSALMVAVFLALAEVNQLAQREAFRRNIANLLDLAGYLGTVENGQTFGSLEGDRGVGTFGGSEDHTAILTAQAGHVSQYAYCPVRSQRAIRLPPDCTFAVGVSGVVAEKTGAAMAKYNAASRLASQLGELWRRHAGRKELHLAAVLGIGPTATDELRQIVRSTVADPAEQKALLTRLEHFLVEDQEVLPAAGDALQRGDLASFGQLVDRSQWGSEHLLGNQVPETVGLAAAARNEGALAASAFGAGFGGSVWALIKTHGAPSFLDQWAAAYRREFPARAESAIFFLAGAGPAAFQLC